MARSVHLVADRPELIEAAGLLRWREWGRPPEPEDPAFWVENVRREAGRDGLPFTLVAVVDGRHAEAGGPASVVVDRGGVAGGREEVIGVVGLGEFDQEDLRDHSPWVMGMVVAPRPPFDFPGAWLAPAQPGRAVRSGIRQGWVATTEAVGFYRRCGWRTVGPVVSAVEGPMTVLTRVW